MSAVERLLAIARNEIGYLEKKTNSNLDDKYANAGHNNYNKYARDLDRTILYNGRKNGFAWCDVFVDWCFVMAFGFDMALKLTCQPTKSCGAGCTYSMNYFKNKGQFYKSNPKPGDQIFFSDDGGKTSYHTGIVEKVAGGRVYTIEGNTSSEPGVVDNGGAVRDKSYALSYSQIGGYGRPDFSLADNSAKPATPTKPAEPTTPSIIDAPIKYNEPKAATVANADVINVRVGPGTNYTKIGTILKGEKINIIGASSDKKWYKFKNSAYADAWMSASYVAIDATIPEIPYSTPKQGKVTARSGLNVRTGPGTNYKVIGALSYGSTLSIVASSKDNKWYRVTTGTYNGWVSASYVEVVANATYKTTTAALYLRSGRGTNYTALALIPKGTRVEVSDLKSNWYKVKYNNINGYSHANYLK